VLRKKKSIVLADDDESTFDSAAAAQAAVAAAPERRSEDMRVDSDDHRPLKVERRSIESLRTEYQKSLTSQAEYNEEDGWRPRGHFAAGMLRPSRVALVAVALIAGGLAAYLATQREPVAAPVEVTAPVVAAAPMPEAPSPPMAQILVAKAPIGAGQRLTEAALEWQDWPEGAVRPEYVTEATAPQAIADMTGLVTRTDFAEGEPIRPEKLSKNGSGVLSGILGKGMRGVSVSIEPESASGGFVVPDDHVDVVLTRTSDGAQVSETILENVRVLAIDAKLGEAGDGKQSSDSPPTAQGFDKGAIATLELGPTQAQVIINATSMGKLSLMLRPTAEPDEPDVVQERAANAAIRLSSPFWAK
jgi:pilus assembly protein CpaB